MPKPSEQNPGASLDGLSPPLPLTTTLLPEVLIAWQDIITPLPWCRHMALVVVDAREYQPALYIGYRQDTVAAGRQDTFWQEWDVLEHLGQDTPTVVDVHTDGSLRFALCIRHQDQPLAYLVGQEMDHAGQGAAPPRWRDKPLDQWRSDFERLAFCLERAAMRTLACHQRLEEVEHRLRQLAAQSLTHPPEHASSGAPGTDHTTDPALDPAYTALERQLRTLGDLQQSFLPAHFPTHPEYRWSHYYRASGEASGDYFDVLPLPNQCVGIIMADVCGHGTLAAVMMAMARILLRSHAARYSDPALLINYVNRLLCRDVGNFIFVTLVYMMLDLRSGRMLYTSAGHPPPLLLKPAQGTVTQLPLPGDVPLNLEPDHEYRTLQSVLLPGDSLVFYTDGVTEVFNPDGEAYGHERLLELLLGETASPAEQLVTRIVDDAETFARGRTPRDDFTLLALQRLDKGPHNTR